MGKKDFKTGIDFLIQESKDNLNEENNNKDNDLEVSEQKATYIFNTERLSDIKAIAYYERKTIGEVLDEALLIYLKQNPMLT